MQEPKKSQQDETNRNQAWDDDDLMDPSQTGTLGGEAGTDKTLDETDVDMNTDEIL